MVECFTPAKKSELGAKGLSRPWPTWHTLPPRQMFWSLCSQSFSLYQSPSVFCLESDLPAGAGAHLEFGISHRRITGDKFCCAVHDNGIAALLFYFNYGSGSMHEYLIAAGLGNFDIRPRRLQVYCITAFLLDHDVRSFFMHNNFIAAGLLEMDMFIALFVFDDNIIVLPASDDAFCFLIGQGVPPACWCRGIPGR